MNDLLERWSNSEPLPLDRANELAWSDRQQAAKARRATDAVRGLEASLGVRYRGLTLDGFTVATPAQRGVVERLRSFTGELPANVQRGEGLFFWGPCGTGKDHLAIACMYQAANMGVSCIAVKGLELFATIREAISGDRVAGVMRSYTTPQVLLLSDPVLQATSVTDFNYQTLARIVDARYEAMKSTWVTINATGEQDAIKLLGGPVFDRLMDGCLTLHCNWPSYRRGRKIR